MPWKFWICIILWVIHDLAGGVAYVKGDILRARTLSIEGSMFMIAALYFTP